MENPLSTPPDITGFYMVGNHYILNKDVSESIKTINALLTRGITVNDFNRYRSILSGFFNTNLISVENDGRILLNEFAIPKRLKLPDNEILPISAIDEEEMGELRDGLLKKVEYDCASSAKSIKNPSTLSWRCVKCNSYFKKDLSKIDIIIEQLIKFETSERKGMSCHDCRTRNFFHVDKSGNMIFEAAEELLDIHK